MKPTLQEFMAAVLAMAEIIPFFPQGEASQRMIVGALDSFVATTEQLTWLTATAVGHMRSWSSLADLRGLFCTRWKPADGRRESCEVPGFTPADCEADFFRREAEETERRIAQWKAEKLLAPPEYSASFELPSRALKLLPKPEPKPAAPVVDPRPLVEIEAEVLARIGPKRSQEETARLTRELEQQVAERKKA